MSDLRKAAEDLMPILDRWKMTYPPCSGADWDKVDALRTALAQPEQNREAEDQLSQENDGCPTEKSVLQRFWRGQEIPKEHYPSWFLSTKPVDTINTSQERVDETAKRGHEPALWLVQYKDRHEFVWGAKPVFRGGTVLGLEPLYTSPPSIEAAVLAEREACAKVCEQPIDEIQVTDDCSDIIYMDGLECAAAIRARSEK